MNDDRSEGGKVKFIEDGGREGRMRMERKNMSVYSKGRTERREGKEHKWSSRKD